MNNAKSPINSVAASIWVRLALLLPKPKPELYPRDRKIDAGPSQTPVLKPLGKVKILTIPSSPILK